MSVPFTVTVVKTVPAWAEVTKANPEKMARAEKSDVTRYLFICASSVRTPSPEMAQTPRKMLARGYVLVPKKVPAKWIRVVTSAHGNRREHYATACGMAPRRRNRFRAAHAGSLRPPARHRR